MLKNHFIILKVKTFSYLPGAMSNITSRKLPNLMTKFLLIYIILVTIKLPIFTLIVPEYYIALFIITDL